MFTKNCKRGSLIYQSNMQTVFLLNLKHVFAFWCTIFGHNAMKFSQFIFCDVTNVRILLFHFTHFECQIYRLYKPSSVKNVNPGFLHVISIIKLMESVVWHLHVVCFNFLINAFFNTILQTFKVLRWNCLLLLSYSANLQKCLLGNVFCFKTADINNFLNKTRQLFPKTFTGKKYQIKMKMILSMTLIQN
jgi:hypothetical protein